MGIMEIMRLGDPWPLTGLATTTTGSSNGSEREGFVEDETVFAPVLEFDPRSVWTSIVP